MDIGFGAGICAVPRIAAAQIKVITSLRIGRSPSRRSTAQPSPAAQGLPWCSSRVCHPEQSLDDTSAVRPLRIRFDPATSDPELKSGPGKPKVVRRSTRCFLPRSRTMQSICHFFVAAYEKSWNTAPNGISCATKVRTGRQWHRAWLRPGL